MASSSNDELQQVDRVPPRDIPNWIDKFLEINFFEKCSNHDQSKNELNLYCITCEASICKHCTMVEDHNGHEILKIYRHVYQNAVPLDQMEKYIDCQKIQSYKCNKMKVLSFTALPHNGSGSTIHGDGACHACRRKLMEPKFHFCSIQCKVKSHSEMNALQVLAFGVDVPRTLEENLRVENQRKRNRKGKPQRAST